MADKPAEKKEQPRQLYRSSTNRVITGVCGGLGEYFVLDPVFFRLVFICLVFAGGSGIVAYLLFSVIIPSDHEAPGKPDLGKHVQEVAEELEEKVKEVKKGVVDKASPSTRYALGGLLLFCIGVMALIDAIIPLHFFGWKYLWPLILVGLGVYLMLRRSK